MGYWKDKVIPHIKKVFDKNTTKKAAAAESNKLFDESKEQYTTEFEEKKTELKPKVVEIYEASSIKELIKDPKDGGIKKQSSAVQKFLDELAMIEFPGAKATSESSSKFGPINVTGPILFVFEKVSTFVVTEEAPAVEVTEKDIVVEDIKNDTETTTDIEKIEPPAETVAEETPTIAAPPVEAVKP